MKRTGTEEDVPDDDHVAGSRAGGGGDSSGEGDTTSTTGTGTDETFVGRTAGDDVGYAGETGAEARKEERMGE